MQNFMLLLVGYNLKKVEHIGWKIFTIINLILLITIVFPELKFVTDNISNVKMATDGLCPLLFGVSSLAKLLTFRLSKGTFYKLIWNLQAMWNECKLNDVILFSCFTLFF